MGISHASQYKLQSLNEDLKVEVYDPNKLVYYFLRFFRLFHNLCPVKFRNIKNKRYEAIFICSPPKFHQSNLEIFFDFNGKFFIEKPGNILTTGKIKKNKIYVGYVLRFSPLIQKIKEHLSTRQIKKIELSLKTNLDFNSAANNWRGKEKTGGGLLNEFGSHCINLSLFFLKDLSLDEITKKDSNNATIYLKNIQGQRVCSIKLNSNSSEVRKAVYKLKITDSDNDMYSTDLYTFSKETSEGVFRESLAEMGMSSEVYIRGHEFSRQMDYFINNDTFDSYEDSYNTDQILKEIHEKINSRR